MPSASSVDDDIAAAFAGKDPPPHETDSHIDDDIKSAFQDSSVKPVDKAKPVYDPSRPAFGDNLEQGLHEIASGGYHSVVGGLKGLGTLIGTRNPDAAAQAVTDEQAKAYHGPAEDLSGASPGIRPALAQLHQMPTGTELGDLAASHGASPGVSTALAVLPTAAATMMAPRAPEAEAAPYVDKQSMGASHVPAPDFSAAEPDVQATVAKMTPQQLDANRPVLERHAEAQSLPVKVRLTAGQATGNPDILSDEMNNRGATGLSQHLNQQGQQLKDNLQVIRENVGPDVFSTNHVEHGDALIQAYKDKDAPIVADINQKYEALHKAAADAGIDTPIDGQTFANTARAALRKKLLGNDVPTSVRADLESFSQGEPMNFEDFESMRTKLAQEMRDNPSGNQRTAAGVVRQALEDVPLQPEAAALKPLADAARQAAKARFQTLEADPAYNAAVNDKVTPDQFVNKYLTGSGGTASRAQAEAMKSNLKDNPQALQTMSVATVDELRKAAGVSQMGEGKFGQSRFNTRLESMRPKMGALLPPEAADQMTTLGKVARYIKEQPEGNVINNSGTLSGAIAQGAGKIAKSYVNVKSGGLAGPVIDYAQSKLNERALKQKYQDAVAPLAGVDIAKP